MVGAAAPTEHRDRAQHLGELTVPGGELCGIAGVERLGLVELRMALRGGVRADAADAVDPRRVLLEDVGEMGRVRAVDHVVVRPAAGGGVDLSDRVGERLAARQSPVRLHGERDRDRHPSSAGRARDADRFLRVGHRERRDEVDARVDEDSDLLGVVRLGRLGGESRRRAVPVALGADAAADHDRVDPVGVGVSHVLEQRDRPAVELVELVQRDAEHLRPVRARTPGRALEHQSGAVLDGDVGVGVVVRAQPGGALVRRQEGERRELREVEPVVEDEHRLEAAVRDVEAAIEVGKRGWHRGSSPRCVRRSSRRRGCRSRCERPEHHGRKRAVTRCGSTYARGGLVGRLTSCAGEDLNLHDRNGH
jgi:hypothetical protein